MSWNTALTELRVLLHDNKNDKLRFLKRLLGNQNGINKRFKTYEYRRVTDFTNPEAGLGVFVNGNLATVNNDDLETGIFELETAPLNTDTLEASYYIQWFLDSEIETFLENSARWLGDFVSYEQIVEGLRPAALKYAAHEAYKKLLLRYSEHQAAVFRLEDSPDTTLEATMRLYQSMSEQLLEEAIKLRDDFYERKGRQLQPLYGFAQGQVPPVVPKR